MMLTHCPYCDKEYKLADELRGKNARCKRCGNVFQLADWEDWLARINPAPTAEEITAERKRYMDKTIEAFRDDDMQALSELRDWDYSNVDPEVWTARKTMAPSEAFVALLPEVTLRNPVYRMYDDFMKICRALNKEDIKAKRWGVTFHRLRLMEALDKKQLDLMWNNIVSQYQIHGSYPGQRPMPKEAEIRAHHSKITITDIKNIGKCQAEIAKLAANTNP